jgi:hypothetical protein
MQRLTASTSGVFMRVASLLLRKQKKQDRNRPILFRFADMLSTARCSLAHGLREAPIMLPATMHTRDAPMIHENMIIPP